MSISKRVRIYALEDLEQHKSPQSCWVAFKGKVYDVTAFVADHPGGDDLILNNAGTDVENIMKDKDSHNHSESAYEMLEEYVIGRLGTEATSVSDGASLYLLLHNFVSRCVKTGKRQTTSIRRIQTRLRTLQRPNSSISESRCFGKCGMPTSGPSDHCRTLGRFKHPSSKSYYLKQVHQPRHLKESARLFGPTVLEVCFTVISSASSRLTAQSGLHSHGMVCSAPSLATHCGQPLLPLDAAIHHANTRFLGCSPIPPLRLVRFVDERILQNASLFLPGKHYLDDIGVWDASLPLPHR